MMVQVWIGTIIVGSKNVWEIELIQLYDKLKIKGEKNRRP